MAAQVRNSGSSVTSSTTDRSTTAQETNNDRTVATRDRQRGVSTAATVTDEKRARKRQLDRIAQRRKRQNDRETMDRLKKSLENPQEPTMIQDLVLKQERDLARIGRHGQRMRQLQALIQADLADLHEEQLSGEQARQSPPSDDSYEAQQPVALQNDGAPIPPTQAQLNTFPATNTVIPTACPQIDLDGLSWDYIAQTNSVQVPIVEDPMLSSCLSAGPGGDYFDVQTILSNDNHDAQMGSLQVPDHDIDSPRTQTSHAHRSSFSHPVVTVQSSRGDQCCSKCEYLWRTTNMNIGLARYQQRVNDDIMHGTGDTGTDAHIMITAIAEGWDVAAQSPWWNEQWTILRQVTQLCHSESGKVEQLVVLYNLSRWLKASLIRRHFDSWTDVR